MAIPVAKRLHRLLIDLRMTGHSSPSKGDWIERYRKITRGSS